ncbi:M3 family peptidase, partial [Escherichia coli]|nr:M3 family peptidase [Escherichia coli]
MIRNLSRRQALLGTSALLATPFMGSFMAHAADTADASPLLAPWPGGYGGMPPWDKFRVEMFPAAFEVAIAEQRREIHAIRDARAAPTFHTVIEPMQKAGD